MILNIKTQLFRLLPKDAFARGVSVLVGGTAGAQLLTVLVAPLLTRIYSPEDFGLLAIFSSLLTIIGMVSCLRYENSIPLPENDDEAANMAVLCLILVGISTLSSVLFVWQIGLNIVDLFDVPAMADYFWLMPIGVLLSGAYNVFNFWSIRTKRFSSIAISRLYQALATIAIQLATFKLGGIALLYARIVGVIAGTACLCRPAVVSLEFRKVTWRGIVKGARRYRRFPIFSTWEGFLNSASVELIPIIFATFFSAHATGLFSLAHRVISLPMSLFSNSVSQVFTSVAPSAKRDGSISELVLALHTKLAYFALPPLMTLAIYGQHLFEYIFGSEWRVSGEFAQWMSVLMYFQFVSSPMSSVFSVYELQKEMLLWQILLMFLRLLAIFAGLAMGDILNTVAFYTLASSIYYILFAFRIAIMTGTSLISFLRPTFKGFVVAVCCNVPIAFAMMFSDSLGNYHYIGFLLSVIAILSWIVFIFGDNKKIRIFYD